MEGTPAPQALPHWLCLMENELSLPARRLGTRGSAGGETRTEAEISSGSGSSTVKTRTSGRATQRFTVLEVALSGGSKINSRKKGLLELHRNPAREAARQASGTDRRSPGACGSWQSFAPFPFFPSTAPETCARASARGGDGGKKIRWLPPRVQGGCSSAPLASRGRGWVSFWRKGLRDPLGIRDGDSPRGSRG